MIDKPLYQNPLGGGILEDSFSNITAPQQIPERYRQGYADFYKQNPDDFQRIGGAAVSYVTTPQGERIQFGDTGGAGNFRRYLESIGETPKANENFFSQDLLAVAGGPEMDSASPPASPGFTPLPDNPPVFMTPGLPPQEEYDPDKYADFAQKAQIKGPGDTLFGVANNPYNRVGQQLTGPDQDDILGTLKNIEQGIASLGQGGIDQSSFGGFNNNFGIGSFFPPYGGMYGQ